MWTVVRVLVWLFIISIVGALVLDHGSGFVYRNGWKIYSVNTTSLDKALSEFIHQGMELDLADPRISYEVFSGSNTTTALALVETSDREYYVELRRVSSSTIDVGCITQGRFIELLQVVKPLH